MRIFFLSIAIAIGLSATMFGQSITANDLKIIEGTKWTGNLAYVDYSSGNKTSIKSDLIVSRKPGDPSTWIFAYEYPDEPNANGTSEVVLADAGKSFNGGTVIEKTRTSDSKVLRIVTTKPGTDNNKKSLFRYSYLIGEKLLAIKKEVQIEGSTEWFIRNEYSWSR